MACSIIRNKETNAIEKVLAPNGQESKLYQDILVMQPDPEQALKTWAQVYTPSFKESFGNWEKLETAKVNDPSIDIVTLENLSKDVSKNVDENGEPLISALGLQNTTPDTAYLQQSSATNVAPKENLDKKINSFLISIGVDVKSVDQIRDKEGNLLTAIAKANILSKTIEVVNGKADVTTLPEEAAHFFVELLGSNHPLVKEMMDTITSFDTYKQTVSTYKDIPLYRNADGTVNFTKIKKEAIGKLIAQYIIAQDSQGEAASNIAKIKTWWVKVWNTITALFKQGPTENQQLKNPFEIAAAQILNNDTTDFINDNLEDIEYLQTEVTAFDRLRLDQARINLDDSIDPVTKQKKHLYTVDGKAVVNPDGTGRSVTSVKVQPFYREKFRTDNRDELQKKINDLQAEWGTDIHMEIENILARKLDKEGRISENPLPATKPLTNPAVYAVLENYVDSLLNAYNQEGTRFMAEVKIYDSINNIAGSIDLVIFLPDGSVDIYDWKSQEIGKYQTELKWFKEPAYRIQLEEYKRILQDQYGVKKFNKVRAIPIATTFNFVKTPTGFMPVSLKTIEIGNIDPSQIADGKGYLLPVVAQDESTGDETLDKLINKLNAVYEAVADKKVKADDRQKQRTELDKIKKAIRDLQIKQDVKSFIENGILETTKYENKLMDNSITLGDILESKNILNVYANADEYLENQMKMLKKQIAAEPEGAKKQELIKMQTDFITMFANASSVVRKLDAKLKVLGEDVAQKNGFFNIMRPEKAMDWLKRTFRSISQLEPVTMKVFYKELSRAQGVRDAKIQQLDEKMQKMMKELTAWGDKKGIQKNQLFDGILNIDEKGNWNGGFLNKYNKEFYQLRDQALKNTNALWIKENTDFDQEAYNKAYKKQEAYINSVNYSTDPLKNTALREQALVSWIERHSNQHQGAFLNTENYFLKPKSKWLSAKYIELQKPENAPLKNAYDAFQELNKQSVEAGMLDKFNPSFIANIYNDKLELTVYSGLSNIFNTQGLFEKLQVDSNLGFGEIDKLDGKLKRKIPVYFTNDIGEKREDGTMDYSNKSRDLFKVFSVWGNHLYNYQAMDSIKDVAETLITLENHKDKESLSTNFFGKVKNDKDTIENNKINAQVLENFVRYYVYGQTLGGDVDKAIKIGAKEYSAAKSGRAVVSFLSIKTLALNVLSGTATFVGGSIGAYLQANKRIYFNTTDWANGLRDFTGRDEITLAALDFFDIGLEDMKQENTNQLSVSKVVSFMTLDKLFIIQRSGDKAVQYPVFGALLHTHMVDNGNIVDIQEHVKAKNNYQGFYNLPEKERKAMRKKIDAEIEELKRTKSLKATAQVVNDKLVIPGVNYNSDAVLNFRNKVKKINKSIIGNATHDDINQIRIGLFGQVLMQFRSWMPQLTIERFGDLAYDTDLDTYTYGKARLFFKHLYTGKFLPLIKEMAFGFNGNTIARAKERYVEFNIRMRETGQEFTMTEAEFIDMYIGNLRSMMKEMMVLLAFSALVMWAKPGDDEEDEKTGIRKFTARALEKYQNEFAFYYSPTEFQKMLKNPVPMMGLLNDTERMFTTSVGQIYGFATNDEEIMKENKPAKYIGKMIPIFKEGMTTYAMFDDDFRKDWDIRIK